MLSKLAAVLAILSLASPGVARAKDDDDKAGDKKLKKPGLELRASPRFSFSPARVMFTAELKGGDDVEDLYCPEIEWEWGDGGKSVEESDCDPWQPGSSTIERRFTAHHTYPRAGLYPVKVTLRKSGRSIVAQTLQVTVRAGLGDVSPDPGM